MKNLLFLAHRMPYPPNKGDKIRSYQLLRYLSQFFRISLGAFVDDKADWRYQRELDQYCADVFLLPLRPRMATFACLQGFFRGEPLTLGYYRSRAMTEWVKSKVEGGIQIILAFSSSMAQYAEPFRGDKVRRYIDFVDLDSEKWTQYGARKRRPMKSIYLREGRLLARYECRVAREFDGAALISSGEARPLINRCPEVESRVHFISNGVDHGYFDASLSFDNPYPPANDVIVFTGAMDYWANVDAVLWFSREVWPKIRSEHPKSIFFIVGARPTRAVRALGGIAGIHVTGTVADVRPYLRHATLAVAPMRIARGIQNKILEAISMQLPVVATSAAVENLRGGTMSCVRVADQVVSFAAAVGRVLQDPQAECTSGAGAHHVRREYSWDNNLRDFLLLLSE